MLKNLVIIPTYNEKENIEEIIRKVFSLDISFDILVVDDNSPDLTYQIVENLQEEYRNQLFLEKRKEKDGLGRAYIHGFRWALKNEYDCIYEMDADFSHNPEDLERLFKALKNENVDMVVGSRYSHGVNVVNWDMKRVLLSYFASKYVQFITGIPIHDTTAGFVGYKKRVLKGLDLSKIESFGYGFQVEMKYKIWKKGFQIVEIPIVFTDRIRGESKMNGGIIKEAALGVLKLRLDQFLNRL
ncbi:dolichyl-phosphate beta-D-mannosyltransferase [Flavobacteriaceae bacterium UJ101]|nr:dolichyl-phosphate beta-D-mannosyltransferase [Flavobacteriaceae bacterium UJ101]